MGFVHLASSVRTADGASSKVASGVEMRARPTETWWGTDGDRIRREGRTDGRTDEWSTSSDLIPLTAFTHKRALARGSLT